MAVVGQPIQWRKVLRKITNASWVSDMIALRKALQFCTGCEAKMPWRWQTRFEYRAFTAYHGDGQCDGCRQDTAVTLYQRTDSPEYAAAERYDRLVQATRARDAGFTVVDRRPWWRIT
jgi:hypothetical protein